MKLVLASGSLSRKQMLAGAELAFESIPADIDEKALREKYQTEKRSPPDIAARLAHEKALFVSMKNPDTLVVGADQILLCEGFLFEKARSRADALQKLRMLSGKTHHLLSAVCVLRNGQSLWSFVDQADMSMRSLNDAEINRYLEIVDDSVLTGNVGAYAVEGAGLWLFEKIKGDYHTILGMPLLPLLLFLSTQGLGP